MSDLAQRSELPASGSDLKLEREGRPWLWILVGLVVVGTLSVAATMLMGKSVVYYKTPTEILAQPSGQVVRMAGTLVKGSIQADAGAGRTTFQISDGKSAVTVLYLGSAATALSTASQPGTQIVAEGSLGSDKLFHSTKLLAKCPSKFQAKTNASS
ncbi:MAG: cytochrome c maturation protein CcmE [Actinomycetes bacterium]